MFLRFTICHSMHQNFILFYDWIISIMWIYQIRLSSQQLMDIWVVFTFCPLWIALQWIWVHMNLCEHQFSFFWVDTQEWNCWVYGNSVFNFWGTAKLCSTIAEPTSGFKLESTQNPGILTAHSSPPTGEWGGKWKCVLPDRRDKPHLPQ